MRWLADILYVLAGLIYLPVALYNAVVLRKNRRGWRQRFGGVPRLAPGRPRIWLHAVSLGEVNATPALVKGLREAMPELDVVVSSTTDTGFARAVQLYGAERVFRFPLDFSFVITRALRRIAPTMLVLVELEVWYNLVHQCQKRGIPVCVVNGRLTPRSARRLAWLGPFARSMFRRMTWVGAQDRSIADRFIALGTPAERVEVTSSMKWDTATVADDVPGMEALRAALNIDPAVPLWVCGSTGPGEEAMILDAYQMLLGPDPAAPPIAIQPPAVIELPDQNPPREWGADPSPAKQSPARQSPAGQSPAKQSPAGQSPARQRPAHQEADLPSPQDEPRAVIEPPDQNPPREWGASVPSPVHVSKPTTCVVGSDVQPRLNPAPRLAIIPRKPERFDEVARLIESRGFTCLRRSLHPDRAAPVEHGESVAPASTTGREAVAPVSRTAREAVAPVCATGREAVAPVSNRCSVQQVSNLLQSGNPSMPAPSPPDARPALQSIILGDTLGELRKFYALATVVFVGRSLVPMGGSDPIEVAALGKPILAGPHLENFADPKEALQAAAALRITSNPQDVAACVAKWLLDPTGRRQSGEAGRAVVRSRQGATAQSCAALCRTLTNSRPASEEDAERRKHAALRAVVLGFFVLMTVTSCLGWMVSFTRGPNLCDWYQWGPVSLFGMGCGDIHWTCSLDLGHWDSLSACLDEGELRVWVCRDLPKRARSSEFEAHWAIIYIHWQEWKAEPPCDQSMEGPPPGESEHPPNTRGWFLWVKLPFWALVLIFGAYPMIAAVAWRRTRRRFARNHCACCGYNLTGLPEPRCPECGTPFASRKAALP